MGGERDKCAAGSLDPCVPLHLLSPTAFAKGGGKGSKQSRKCTISLIPFPLHLFLFSPQLTSMYKTTLNFKSKDFRQMYHLIHRKIWYIINVSFSMILRYKLVPELGNNVLK